MFDNGILLTAATLTVLTSAKLFLARGSRGVVRAGRTAPQATGRRRLHHLEQVLRDHGSRGRFGQRRAPMGSDWDERADPDRFSGGRRKALPREAEEGIC